MFWLVLGAVFGVLFVVYMARRPVERRYRYAAVGLIVAAAIYVVFAATAGVTWFAIELGGLALFALLGSVGVRRFPLLLAIGWTLHVGWDVGLHLLSEQPVVTSWYPLMCVTFDLLVAASLLVAFAQSQHVPGTPLPDVNAPRE